MARTFLDAAELLRRGWRRWKGPQLGWSFGVLHMSNKELLPYSTHYRWHEVGRLREQAKGAARKQSSPKALQKAIDKGGSSPLLCISPALGHGLGVRLPADLEDSAGERE